MRINIGVNRYRKNTEIIDTDFDIVLEIIDKDELLKCVCFVQDDIEFALDILEQYSD